MRQQQPHLNKEHAPISPALALPWVLEWHRGEPMAGDQIRQGMNIFRQSKIIFERHAGEETVQVIQRGEKLELRFGNHIVQSAMSIRQPDHLLLEYTQAMMTGFAIHPDPVRTLQIGLGAGAITRFIHRHFPGCTQDIVEISPVVIEAATRHFKLPASDRLNIIESDGHAFLKSIKRQYDLIFQDAFEAEGVAGHLQTREYFLDLRRVLAPGGVLVNNAWGSNQTNLRHVAAHMSAVFGQLYSISVGVGTNVIFFAQAQRRALPLRDILRSGEEISARIPFDLTRWVRQLQKVNQPENGPLAGPLARTI